MKKLITIIITMMAVLTLFGAPKVAEVASIYKGIVELKVKLGDKVKKGQLLFEVNQDILNTEKKCNEETYKFLNDVLEGGKKLIKKESISHDDYEQCVRDIDVAKAALDNTKAQIKYSKYYAPFDGTVTNIVRYDGSGLGDNDNEIQVTEGVVDVNTSNPIVALVCNRWPGVLELKVEEGQQVKKGQLLFTIGTADIEAQIAEAEANKKYAQTTYERQKKLYGKTSSHATSLYKYSKSEDDFRKAKANLEKLKIQLKQCPGYAPFDGTITRVYRYTGSGNGAGKPVVDITQSVKPVK